jgi:hypothetical protein
MKKLLMILWYLAVSSSVLLAADMTIDSSGNIGIGTDSPSYNLDVVGKDQENAIIGMTGYYGSINNRGSVFIGRRARGSIASPSAVQADDLLISLGGAGYGTSGWGSTPSTRGRMAIYAAENWTDTAQGAYIKFVTTPVGTDSVSERMRITSEGDVGIGTGSPSTKLDVLGTINATSFTGDGSGLSGILTSEDDPVFTVWDKSTGISITESQISDLNHFTTGSETDPEVGSNEINYVPVWDGGALSSGSIYDDGDIGIGTTTPNSQFELASDYAIDSRYLRLTLTSYYDLDAGHPAIISGRRARGSMGTPTAIQNGDAIFSVGARGYDGTAFGGPPNANIVFDATENFTDTAHGTAITFDTTANGTTTPFSERMRIDHNGNVGIGTTSPQSALQVNGYTQLALTSGEPPSGDCDEASELGRMKVDNSAGVLYVCVDSGWVSK